MCPSASGFVSEEERTSASSNLSRHMGGEGDCDLEGEAATVAVRGELELISAGEMTPASDFLMEAFSPCRFFDCLL